MRVDLLHLYMFYVCLLCNRAKGTDLGSIDAQSGQLTPFFHPRQQTWPEHFELEEATIVPLTAEGRVTVAILQLNHRDRLRERQQLQQTGRYFSS